MRLRRFCRPSMRLSATQPPMLSGSSTSWFWPHSSSSRCASFPKAAGSAASWLWEACSVRSATQSQSSAGRSRSALFDTLSSASALRYASSGPRLCKALWLRSTFTSAHRPRRLPAAVPNSASWLLEASSSCSAASSASASPGRPRSWLCASSSVRRPVKAPSSSGTTVSWLRPRLSLATPPGTCVLSFSHQRSPPPSSSKEPEYVGAVVGSGASMIEKTAGGTARRSRPARSTRPLCRPAARRLSIAPPPASCSPPRPRAFAAAKRGSIPGGGGILWKATAADHVHAHRHSLYELGTAIAGRSADH